MSPVNAQTDFGDALDDTWDEKLTGFLNKIASQPYKYDYFSLLRQLESVKFVTGGKLLGKAVSPKMEKIRSHHLFLLRATSNRLPYRRVMWKFPSTDSVCSVHPAPCPCI